MIQLTAADGHLFDAYEVHPVGATAAIVVIQEIFGVNAHIRSVVDAYAAAGYHAIAPALFDRSEPGVELDYNAEGVAAGRPLAHGLDWSNTMADVGAAIAHVESTGPVGVVGYCFGGTVAWAAAHESRVAAAVGYYGGGVRSMIDSQPACPTMLHFGALDAHIPLDDVREVGERHPAVAIHVYDEADHGFNCDVRASYHQPSAELALGRTLDFFRANKVA